MGDSGDATTSVTLINKLDFGDPLYLHPSDTTSGTPIISIKLKGTENYNIWSRSMLLALGTKNKIGFINGTCVKNTTDEVLAAQWERCNTVVLSWILGTLTEELYSGQIFNSLALNVWNDLKETYDKKDGSVIFNLHHKINSLKQNDSPLSEYYHNLNSLWKQYDSMVSSPPCTCGADACTCAASVSVENNNKMIKLMQFLMGLNDVYMPIRSNILLRDPLPDVKVAYAIISREESHRINSLKDTNSKSQNSAFAAQGPNKSYNNNNNNNMSNFNNNRGPNPNLKCKKCNKIGHTIERCFEVVGYPPNFKRNTNNNNRNYNNFNNFKNTSNNNATSKEASTSSSTPLSFSNEHMLKLLSLINDVPAAAPANAMSNMEGTFFNASIKFNTNFNKFFNSNLSQTKVIHKGWIIDSGANQYMTLSSNGLSNIVDVSGLKLTVGHPNGTQALIKGIGDLVLKKFITLKDVLIVPEYCVSLMSVSKLSKDNGLIVSFNESTCYVQDLRDRKIKRIGNQEGGLYIFNNLNKEILSVLKTKLNLKDKINTEPCEFQQKIKVFRSDNGTKFVNQKFLNFTNSKGIVHQTTCAYTPQQNGIVERKHRHLLNVARALMFQGGLPLNMWSECILTSCYLINRTPTAVLNGKSPYETVFKSDPNLSHLKCFGCLCFSVDLNPKDKFSSRSTKCILIGFSNVKKGYKLLSLEDKSIFYSRDVKLYETVFPLKHKSAANDFKIDFSNNTLNQNFFDDIFKFDTNYTSSPNDEGRVTDTCEGSSDKQHIMKIHLHLLRAILMLLILNQMKTPMN
ncbi:uncharacterized protein [Rutidosis leptorrhynchoides]|uniref:uncharacterized protein n=1 Tax=Rutidosis leptorrhynchoides TaxID=125765 RepID=UPI003A99F015